ncbi:MAG: hypothetical protein AVDCRST_MAG27-2393, partial [uncultured Craurococcus sp.]
WQSGRSFSALRAAWSARLPPGRGEEGRPRCRGSMWPETPWPPQSSRGVAAVLSARRARRSADMPAAKGSIRPHLA